MTPVEFLKARLDEIETKARRVEPLREIDVWGQKFPEGRSHARLSYRSEDGANWTDPDPDAWAHFDQWSPTFALAQIAAQRKVIDLHEQWPVLVEQPDPGEVVWNGMHDTVLQISTRINWLTTQEYRKRFGDEPPTGPIIKALIQPFSDHPDFEEDWRQ